MRRKKYLKESANFYFEDDDFWKFDDVEESEPKNEKDDWVEDIWGDDEQEEQLGESLIDELLGDIKKRAGGKNVGEIKGSSFEENTDDSEEERKHAESLRPILNKELYQAFRELKISIPAKVNLAQFFVNFVRGLKGKNAAWIERNLTKGTVRTFAIKYMQEWAKEAFEE
jgi:hypothetical protein